MAGNTTDKNSEWKLVYTTTYPHKAEIVQAIFEDENINYFTSDKRDTTYTFMGEIEIYVTADHFEKAMDVINTNQL